MNVSLFKPILHSVNIALLSLHELVFVLGFIEYLAIKKRTTTIFRTQHYKVIILLD